MASGVTMGWLLRLVTGGPTGGRGPPTVVFYFKSEGRGPGWLRYASDNGCGNYDSALVLLLLRVCASGWEDALLFVAQQAADADYAESLLFHQHDWPADRHRSVAYYCCHHSDANISCLHARPSSCNNIAILHTLLCAFTAVHRQTFSLIIL